jgi:hypothetical protein
MAHNHLRPDQYRMRNRKGGEFNGEEEGQRQGQGQQEGHQARQVTSRSCAKARHAHHVGLCDVPWCAPRGRSSATRKPVGGRVPRRLALQQGVVRPLMAARSGCILGRGRGRPPMRSWRTSSRPSALLDGIPGPGRCHSGTKKVTAVQDPLCEIGHDSPPRRRGADSGIGGGTRCRR